ncbi:MAG: metalloregulator ArsR/SmtB family transcription factor [Deltaproteobacteria bacterium]|nr:metalloregulator ArsR/SmtB family transcription factor [Deltaproteobacteria bacterium]
MRDLAIIFGALADPTRLEMLALLLRNDELCVCDFVETLGISQSKASRHLRYLWNAHLLEDRRAGLWVYYRISPSMDGDRRKLVAALSKVLAGRDLTELEGRLSSWLKRKTKTIGCAASPQGKTPAAAPPRVRKLRRAQEARR